MHGVHTYLLACIYLGTLSVTTTLRVLQDGGGNIADSCQVRRGIRGYVGQYGSRFCKTEHTGRTCKKYLGTVSSRLGLSNSRADHTGGE